MKGLIKVISVLVSIVFSLFFILFILGLSFRAYNINDFNDMVYLWSNDLNVKITSLDYIYEFSFIRNNSFTTSYIYSDNMFILFIFCFHILPPQNYGFILYHNHSPLISHQSLLQVLFGASF